MSKEAQDFYRSKKVESAKTERMKKFLSLVNYEEEGKIMQEYADEQLRLCGVSGSVGANIEDTLMEMTAEEIEKEIGICSLCKYKKNHLLSSVCQKCLNKNSPNQYYR